MVAVAVVVVVVVAAAGAAAATATATAAGVGVGVVVVVVVFAVAVAVPVAAAAGVGVVVVVAIVGSHATKTCRPHMPFIPFLLRSTSCTSRHPFFTAIPWIRVPQTPVLSIHGPTMTTPIRASVA